MENGFYCPQKGFPNCFLTEENLRTVKAKSSNLCLKGGRSPAKASGCEELRQRRTAAGTLEKLGKRLLLGLLWMFSKHGVLKGDVYWPLFPLGALQWTSKVPDGEPGELKTTSSLNWRMTCTLHVVFCVFVSVAVLCNEDWFSPLVGLQTCS